MALADYANDMAGCTRCSSCKWLPFQQMRSWRFAKNCPSVTRHNLHAYAGGGRMVMGMSMLEGRSELTDGVADIIYKCNMCGACDTACKVYRDDMDLGEVLLEMRTYCVEQGRLIPEHMFMIDAMKKEDNVLGEPKAERGAWAEGLGLKDINKDKADVFFHVGCRYSYDQDLRPVIHSAMKLMRQAGVEVGIAGKEESCCGGRAYELGFRGEAENYADDMLSRVKASGAKMVVISCSDCFSHFKYLYPRMGKEMPVEVLHITEYMRRLVDEGKLRLKNQIPMRVTYHDPCHLGRMGEPYLGEWNGNKMQRPLNKKRAGRGGVYDAPRELLAAIPGVQLVEMERIREWSWCCGAGGGVLEAYPDFANWTASERLAEALSTGAEALVTACPWCERAFADAMASNGKRIRILDLAELVSQATGA